MVYALKSWCTKSLTYEAKVNNIGNYKHKAGGVSLPIYLSQIRYNVEWHIVNKYKRILFIKDSKLVKWTLC